MIHDRVAQAEATDENVVFFSEEHRPLVMKTPRGAPDVAPSEVAVVTWLSSLVYRLQLPAEVVIASLAYLERLNREGVRMFRVSWRPLTVGAVLLAMKMWRESSQGIAQVAEAQTLLTIEELRLLESELLRRLDYDLCIARKLHTQYYFAMRSLVQRQRNDRALNPRKAATLEARGGRYLSARTLSYQVSIE